MLLGLYTLNSEQLFAFVGDILGFLLIGKNIELLTGGSSTVQTKQETGVDGPASVTFCPRSLNMDFTLP